MFNKGGVAAAASSTKDGISFSKAKPTFGKKVGGNVGNKMEFPELGD